MKKILQYLFTVTLLTACGSGSGEEVIDPPVPVEKTYSVTFNVSIFGFEEKPLDIKSVDSREIEPITERCIIYVVYAEDGSVVKQIGKDVEDSNPIKIEESLEAGNYRLAVFSGQGSYEANKETYRASNFDTDMCYGTLKAFGNYHNKSVYYSWKDFTVKPQPSNTPVDLELKPMWTQLRIYLEDKATCIFPEGTTIVRVSCMPKTYGFTIKDGKGILLTGLEPEVFRYADYTIDQVRELEFIGDSYPLAQSDNSELKLVYLSSSKEVLAERTIFDGEWETGWLLKFTGKVNTPSEAFELSLGTLTPIEKPFDK